VEPPFLVKIPGVPRPFRSFVKLSEGAFSFPSLIVTDLSGFSLAGVEDSYFSQMPRGGALVPAMIVAVIVGSLVWTDEVMSLKGSLDSLKSMPQVREALESGRLGERLPGFPNLGGFASMMGLWILGVPLMILGLGFSWISLHGCLMALSAGGGGLNETGRVLAYSSTGALIALVPMVGSILSLILVSIQLVAGLAQVHEASVTRILIAMSLPLILACLFLVAVVGWLFLSF